MQVTTLSTQLGLGSELVDWYRDTTSVPFGQLLFDLSPQTDDRLRYCTNSGSVPSKLCIPESLELLMTLDDEYTKSLYPPSVSIAFPQMQKSLSSVMPKRVYPFSMRKHSESTQRKLAKVITCKCFKRKFGYYCSKEQLGSKEGTFYRQKEGCN